MFQITNQFLSQGPKPLLLCGATRALWDLWQERSLGACDRLPRTTWVSMVGWRFSQLKRHASACCLDIGDHSKIEINHRLETNQSEDGGLKKTQSYGFWTDMTGGQSPPQWSLPMQVFHGKHAEHVACQAKQPWSKLQNSISYLKWLVVYLLLLKKYYIVSWEYDHVLPPIYIYIYIINNIYIYIL